MRQPATTTDTRRGPRPMRASSSRRETPRRDPNSLDGLFILRVTDGDAMGPVYARIEGDLYVMAFTNMARAQGARTPLGVDEAIPFYICAANHERTVGELRAAGVRGFIVDFDPTQQRFVSAGELV